MCVYIYIHMFFDQPPCKQVLLLGDGAGSEWDFEWRRPKREFPDIRGPNNEPK